MATRSAAGVGRIKYVGITNNPRRRAAQHRRAGKSGRLRVETGGLSRGKARRWGGAKLARFRKRIKGRNPTHNNLSDHRPLILRLALTT